MGRLSQLEGQRFLRALAAFGWNIVRVSGSHHVLHNASGATIVVPVHRGRPLKEGTVRGILRQAAIDVNDFLAVY